MNDTSRWLAVLASPGYWYLGLAYTLYMTFLWRLRRTVRNAGLVDFGWPSGLILLAGYFWVTGDGWAPRRAVLCGLFALCGLRFLVGWVIRNTRDGEDRRWEFWRRHWREGQGILGIRSLEVNFLIFYHAQTLATLLVLAAPLAIAAGDSTLGFTPLEVVAIIVWSISFALENLADYQLDRFRRSSASASGVCRTGLWAYSRHPNYFFEFLLWVAYLLFAWEAAVTWTDRAFLLAVPILAYWFLVYYTGVPLTEHASLQRRGDSFRRYQLEVNRFVPWFPKST